MASEDNKKEIIHPVGPVRILHIDMTRELHDFIFKTSLLSIQSYYRGEKTLFTEIASQIKNGLQEQEKGAWHVIVGKSFGSFVTHEMKQYVQCISNINMQISHMEISYDLCSMTYFFIGPVGFLIFRHG